MLCVPPTLERTQSFGGSLGVAKVLLELRDGDGSLEVPLEEVGGGAAA